MRILVTRPLPEADRTALSLAALGHEAMLAPMLSIAACDFTLPQRIWGGVVITSGNAARAVASRVSSLMTLPVFAVGRQTAAASREAGFTLVISADGDGADLVDSIAARGLQSPLLYLAGSDRARDLASELAARGIRLETVVVYRAEAATEFSREAAAALREGRIGGVLHYSRRTAAAFCECSQAARVPLAEVDMSHYCLSRRASEPLAQMGAKSLHIAASPDEDALFRLLPPA